MNPSLQCSTPRLVLHLFIELPFRGDVDSVLKENRRCTLKNSYFRAFEGRKMAVLSPFLSLFHTSFEVRSTQKIGILRA